MFRALLCSSSGGQNCIIQHLVSSQSVGGRPVHKLRVDSGRINCTRSFLYRGADKSLARPGRKQARKHVRDARDFNNIEMRAVTKFSFPARQEAEGNSRDSDRNISLFPSWSG